MGLAAGEPVPRFSAVSTSGELISAAGPLRTIAFFSSACSICRDRVEPFLTYLRGHQLPKDAVVSVSVGAADYLDRIAEVSRVCLEQEDGLLVSAFQVAGFPAFCLLAADGTLLASSYDPASLPAPADLAEPAT